MSILLKIKHLIIRAYYFIFKIHKDCGNCTHYHAYHPVSDELGFCRKISCYVEADYFPCKYWED